MDPKELPNEGQSNNENIVYPPNSISDSADNVIPEKIAQDSQQVQIPQSPNLTSNNGQINMPLNQLPPSPKKSILAKKTLIIALIAILAVSVLSAAYVLNNKSQEKTNETTGSLDEQTEDEKDPTDVEDSDSDNESESTNNEGTASERDVERVTDINNVHSKLEEYHNENGAYPQTFTASTFPGIEERSLIDPNGNSIVIGAAAEEGSIAASSISPDANNNYSYVAYPTGCTDDCTGYVLKSFIENPTSSTPNPYVKLGLNNN